MNQSSLSAPAPQPKLPDRFFSGSADQSEHLAALVAPLSQWYRQNRKSFPWRESPTPYHVWISEIMLQQTRIEAALPYYERFLLAFPDVQALAQAPEDELLKAWQGLGYYSRARNLKKAAKQILDTYGGALPQDAAALKKLPGIGDYTAGAIASIAMGLPEPAVDGNVLRVIMRYTACADDVMSMTVRTRVAEALRQIYPSGKEAGILTEALMELGETVCAANAVPRCGECPLCRLCRAQTEGNAAILPVRKKPKPRRIEQRTVLVLRCGTRVALRRRGEGLLAGMWELPNEPVDITPQQLDAYLAAQGVHMQAFEDLGNAKHIFSHIEWHMHGYAVTCDRCFSGKEDELIWASAQEIREKYAIPAAFAPFRTAYTDTEPATVRQTYTDSTAPGRHTRTQTGKRRK
ncbi:MAG: A/G-specific adenine glycosylase [Eubacteriales bacterium]